MTDNTLVNEKIAYYQKNNQVVARIVRMSNKARTFGYTRLDVYCEQAGELVTSEFAQGEINKLQDTYARFTFEAAELGEYSTDEQTSLREENMRRAQVAMQGLASE